MLSGTNPAAGILLEESKDNAGPLGYLYCRAGEGLSSRYSSQQGAFIFPRNSTVLKITSGGTTHELDAFSTLLVPPQQEIHITCTTALSEFVVLWPSPELRKRTCDQYHLPENEFVTTLSSITTLPRTNWINEIMHRYIFERSVAGNRNNDATNFLEVEIIKEIYFISRVHDRALRSIFNLDGNNLDKKSPLLKKALHFIESNLFKDISIGELARHIAASESSLLRTFHKEIHRTPIGYIKERRLDEALKLLKSNKYTIGEISDLVGYESVSAFTSSFKKRFGVTPQHYREI